MPRPKPSRRCSTSGCFHGARTSWTARTTTVTNALKPLALLLAFALGAGAAGAQGVREHTRLAGPKGTKITESQAAALTLTLSAVSPRLIQTWIRTAGTIDKTGRILSATLSGPEAALVKTGQRLRAFPPSSKSSMYQAYVTRVTPHASGVGASTAPGSVGASMPPGGIGASMAPGRIDVQATLTASGRENAAVYVMEIVVERGPFLSVPNEAIIEEGDRHVVYVQQQPGQYVPVEIQIGMQGELFTQVLGGVKDDAQVVTFGSFFIDAEHKLKGAEQDLATPQGQLPPVTTPDDHTRH